MALPVRRHALGPDLRLAPARDLHPALVAGEGGARPEPRPPRTAHDRQLARCARRLRHDAAGRRVGVRPEGGKRRAGQGVVPRPAPVRSGRRDPGARLLLRRATFIATALIVWLLIKTPGRVQAQRQPSIRTPVDPDAEAEPEPGRGFRQTVADIREGWRFIFENPVVRAVNVGLAAGLLGGAMLVPLGPTFAKYVLGDAERRSRSTSPRSVSASPSESRRSPRGSSAFRRSGRSSPRSSCPGCSSCFGISMSTFWLSAIFVFGMGLCAGAVYILGYTLLQENTEDELRGRTFTTFLTLVRLCVLGAMVLGPDHLGPARSVAETLDRHPGAAGYARRRRVRREVRPAGCPGHPVVRWPADPRRVGHGGEEHQPRGCATTCATLGEGVRNTASAASHDDDEHDRAGAVHRLRGRRGMWQVDPGRAPRRSAGCVGDTPNPEEPAVGQRLRELLLDPETDTLVAGPSCC